MIDTCRFDTIYYILRDSILTCLPSLYQTPVLSRTNDEIRTNVRAKAQPSPDRRELLEDVRPMHDLSLTRRAVQLRPLKEDADAIGRLAGNPLLEARNRDGRDHDPSPYNHRRSVAHLEGLSLILGWEEIHFVMTKLRSCETTGLKGSDVDVLET